MDMTASTEARSDQINAVDLVQPRTYTIEKVTAGKATHPFDFHLVESPGKVYRPNLGQRRVIVAGWGAETSAYHGRRFTLFNEPTVIYAGAEIGGIRISHMSHLDKPLKTSLAISQKKKVPYIVQPLSDVAPPTPAPDTATRATKAVEWFAAKGIVQSVLEAHVGKPIAEWDDGDLAALKTDSDVIVGDDA
ncbi:hypothetical protein [Aeromicrobium sp.]|uniref:hypothetical protein n=1 Tax=Aeromicrobium sp. TaxID=1871063 RepID=UPI002FC8E711